MFKKIIPLLIFSAVIIGAYSIISDKNESEEGIKTVQVFFGNFRTSEDCSRVFSAEREVPEKLWNPLWKNSIKLDR
jgi:hypothetical protein